MRGSTLLNSPSNTVYSSATKSTAGVAAKCSAIVELLPVLYVDTVRLLTTP